MHVIVSRQDNPTTTHTLSPTMRCHDDDEHHFLFYLKNMAATQVRKSSGNPQKEMGSADYHFNAAF